MNMVIFRENTEDVYAGIEWAQGTPEAKKIIEFLAREMGKRVRPGLRHRHQADVGDRHQAADRAWRSATPSTTSASSVTLVHKGNIMKFTEGAFRDWGYELAKAEFRDQIVTEDES